jgi:AraC-like DNA-binding protein
VGEVAPTFARGTPHPALAGVVLRYEAFTQTTGAPAVFRELPCSFVPIIIDLDAGWTITHAGRSAQRLGSFVAGVTDSTVLVAHGGTANCLQIDLTVLGARRLLGMPMTELANRTTPIEDVLGLDGHLLVQRIGEAPDWQTRFALVDAAIRTRLAQAPEVDAGVAWSLERITAAPIGVLVTELGWSHRRLIARYRDAVGLPPKMVARIVRFETLTARLTRADVDWATLAVDCGFFDQAHLAREVRDLAGLTPTELLVNFVQDEPAAPS